MIRVLLVDDHASFRQPLAFRMQREPDITVVAQAGTLAEARSLLQGVDVAVIDLGLPDGDGVELVRELRAANPHGMVLVLTAGTTRLESARAVEAGASGVLHKSAGIAELMSAVRRLGAGEPLLSPREVAELLGEARRHREREREARAALAQLTAREREVLQALAEGLSDKDIAERLRVAPKTVRAHMVNILGKLGQKSRLQAFVLAVRHGAVRID